MSLRLLYVGQLERQRAAAFTAFLGEHFESVRTAALAELAGVDVSDVDVVLVDGEPQNGGKVKEVLSLGDFPRPTVLIGGTGATVADTLRLKLGWRHGCLCLERVALIEQGTTSHGIFTGPVPVPEVQTERTPTPENFLAYAAVKDVPLEFDVAHLQTTSPTPTAEEIADLRRQHQSLEPLDWRAALGRPEYGVVSTGAALDDSPDTERILGGFNAKAHDYVAVGRQGRFLQWGYGADPTQLTDLGKALLLNSIHYIAGFADAAVLVTEVAQPREMLEVAFGFLDAYPDAAADVVAGRLGSDVAGAVGTTTADALCWFAKNKGYLRPAGAARGGPAFELDAELVSLGRANDDPALLDLLADLLDAPGQDGERARTLWSRYTDRPVTDTSAERRWLADHRQELFFSDWGGYRWIAASEAAAADTGVSAGPRSRTDDAPHGGPSPHGPIRATLAVREVPTGTELDVEIQLAPGYYAYAPGSIDGIPISAELLSHGGARLLDGPTYPSSENGRLYSPIRIPMRVQTDADEVRVRVTVQACDVQTCTMPTVLELSGRRDPRPALAAT